MHTLAKCLLPIILFSFVGCNNQSKRTATTIHIDSSQPATSVKKIDNSEYYTKQDSILIDSTEFNIYKVEKKEFNQLVDKHPEFFEDYPSPPDEDYDCYNTDPNFSSEVGQDTYYVYYAYFLKQKNGIEKHADCRDKLIKIYSAINSLFGRFQYGGTYFGHQYPRIEGYAEYSVFIYSQINNNFEKTYDIKKQKELYIKSLRQLIDDEDKIDFQTLGKAKASRRVELNKTVDIIEESITNIFYLRQAQEFQYKHYQYY